MTQGTNGREGKAEAEIERVVVEDSERKRDTENENHNGKDATGCALQPKDI